MDELSFYDYDLPPELIAREPLPRRDDSRMLVIDRRTEALQHQSVRELPEILRPGDRLVLNDTQVVPARLFGYRAATGGKWEGLFLGTLPSGQWRLIGHAGGKLRAGDVLVVVPAHDTQPRGELTLGLVECDDEGIWTARPSSELPPLELLGRFGTVPLPPYMRRKLGSAVDWDRYQTAYARRPGAIAAPTAGLHFTPQLLAECQRRGIDRSFVTLHVGIGTFRPVAVERLEDHVMHSEWCEVPEETCGELQATRRSGGRIIAVGTTTVRTLETCGRDGSFRPWRGETGLFIRPPHEFRGVDALLTNFHLPRSTLFVLVCAFGGIELIRRAYESAVRERYRFYSYGDSMLIL